MFSHFILMIRNAEGRHDEVQEVEGLEINLGTHILIKIETLRAQHVT